MFEEWGFLLTEIWFLLAVAGLIGLLAGWIIWGGQGEAVVDTREADRLRAELADCRAKGERLAALLAEMEARRAAVIDTAKTLPPVTAGPMVMPQAQVQPQALVGGAAAGARAAGPEATVSAGVRPVALDGPRGGRADDLKLIKGVGPKLEKLCNSLGFWHFDQIASWTPAELAWVDDNLEGFKGRVSRDEWVTQARDLAASKA